MSICPLIRAMTAAVFTVQYVEDGMGDDNDYRMLRWQTVQCRRTVNKLPVGLYFIVNLCVNQSSFTIHRVAKAECIIYCR